MLNFPSNWKLKISLEKLYIYVLCAIFFNEWLAHISIFSSFYLWTENFTIALIIFLMILNIYNSKYRLGQLVIVVTLLLLGLYTYTRTNVIWIFYMLFLALFVRNISLNGLLLKIRDIMRLVWITNITFFLIQYIFSYETLPIVLSRGMTRFCLNFSGPAGAATFWTMYIFVVFMVEGKKNVSDIVRYTLMGAIVYYFTKSEIVFLSFVPWGIDFLKKKYSITKIVRFCAKWGNVFYSLFSIFTFLFYHRVPFLQFINVFLTGRLSMLAKSYEYYGFTMFGQKVYMPAWVEMNGVFELINIDNVFASIMINYGFIYLLPIVILPIVSVNKLTDKECIVVMLYEVLLFMVEGIFSPFFIAPFLILIKRVSERSDNMSMEG